MIGEASWRMEYFENAYIFRREAHQAIVRYGKQLFLFVPYSGTIGLANEILGKMTIDFH